MQTNENGTQVRTELTRWIGHVGLAGLAEPRLSGTGRGSAGDAAALGDAIAAFVDQDAARVALDHLVSIRAVRTQADAAHPHRRDPLRLSLVTAINCLEFPIIVFVSLGQRF